MVTKSSGVARPVAIQYVIILVGESLSVAVSYEAGFKIAGLSSLQNEGV